MAVTSTSAVNSAYLSSTDTASRLPAKTLDQDDFLKLLVAQMTSQDPLNPKADLDSIAQMAQFSALEQSKSMQSQMAELATQQQFLQANALLGQTVQLQVSDGVTATGVVSAVQIEDGVPKLVVGNEAFDLSQVLTITSTPANN